jgi:hypothetical protein
LNERDARDTVILNGARDLNMENAAIRAIVELSVEVLRISSPFSKVLRASRIAQDEQSGDM